MRALAAVMAVIALTLSGCGGDGEQDRMPDVAACKAAMKAQLDKAMSDPNAPSGTRPPECVGVDDETLQRLAGEVMSEAMETATPGS